MTHRRTFLAAIGALVTAAAERSGAQGQYPNRPIRLVIPFPPGGGADLVWRSISVPLGEALGQPILLEYKPGADGVIAAEALMKAPPDGYSLLVGSGTGMSGAPAFRKSIPYDPVADFTPISLAGTYDFFLFVNPDVPARNMPELLTYARANPGKLNYGSGTGSAIVMTAQIAQAAKLDLVHVPFKGDAPMFIEFLAGRVHMGIASGAAGMEHVRAGKLRALVAVAPHRSLLLPDVPTVGQTGIELSIALWNALVGPAGVPRDVVDRLNREFVKVLARADLRERLGSLGFNPQSSTPDELRAFVKEQLGAWKRAAVTAGIQPE